MASASAPSATDNAAPVVEKVKKQIIKKGAGGGKSLKLIIRRFGAYDDNNDKQITFEEFAAGLKDHGISITDKEARAAFDGFDMDKSGSLSVNEFITGK